MSSNTMSKVPTNRLPAPSLFVGPPSRNASNTSLGLHSPPSSTMQPSSARAPLVRQPSHLASKRQAQASASNDQDVASVTSAGLSGPFARRQHQQTIAVEAESQQRADAIWAEMQNTLEEVELSAIKGPGMTVFGSEHSKALDELRYAQIELAKAWARSEAEEEGQGVEERMSARGTDARDMLAHDRGDKAGVPEHVGLQSGGNERSRLEEETEKDIELSRKRREANDRYFERVNKGVLEVVMKLEEVASAMKGVEAESKEIWRDGESVDTDIASVRTESVA